MRFPFVHSLALAAVSFAALASSPKAEASTVLVSNLTSNPGDYWFAYQGGPAAGLFTLTGPASITSATLVLERFDSTSAADFSISIVNDNAGVLGSTVYGSVAGSGTLPSSAAPFEFDFSTAVNLAAGNYWLKLTTPADVHVQWSATLSPVNTGSDGTAPLRLLYSAAGNPVYLNSEAFLFSLNGTSAPVTSVVPEPGAMAKVGGVMAFWLATALRRARRRIVA